MAADTIHTVSFPRNVTDNRIEASGPLAVFTQPVTGDSRSPIWLADLATGTLRSLYSPSVPVSIFEPVISGQTVAWMEARGSSTWTVKVMRLGDSAPSTVATFVAPTDRAGVIRIDGPTMAYVIPGSAGQGDSIQVVSTTAPYRPIRKVHISEAVFKLGLARESLFWDQGKVTVPPQLSFHDTSAWLLTATGTTPRKVADDAFELGFDGTWMIWVRDPTDDGNGNQIVALKVGETTPVVLTPEPEPNTPGGLYRSIWPSSGDGLAAWSSEGPQDFSLSVWPVGTSTPVGLVGEPLRSIAVAGTSIGSNWLDWNEAQAFGGAKVSDILAAIKAAGIH